MGGAARCAIRRGAAWRRATAAIGVVGVLAVAWREPSPGVSAQAAAGPLRVHPTNPRYFTDGSGRAVLVAGAHTWYTLQDGGFSDPPRSLDYAAYVNAVAAAGQNFFRLFVWEQAKGSVLTARDYYYSPLPYRRTGPGAALDGKPRFDLTSFDQTYFDRLRQRVQAAGARGIYVSVQLFEGFSVEAKPFRAAANPWPGHPFNRSNNVNGIDGDLDRDGQGSEVHSLRNPAVTALQDAYVRKVVDTVNDLDNVLYEVCNEAYGESQDWQAHVISVVKAYEATKGRAHPVGMTVEWPGGDNAELFASQADWISPNSSGGYFDNPPPADGRKVIVNDTDHLCYPCGDASFVWRSVTRGLNPAFMDAYDCQSDVESGCNPNEPVWVATRANLGYARTVTGRVNLAAMTPRPDLCSSTYCLANPAASGAEYLAFLPAGGSVTLDLSATTRSLSVEWFNPASGGFVAAAAVTGGAPRSISAPFDGPAVVLVRDGSVATVDAPAVPQRFRILR